MDKITTVKGVFKGSLNPSIPVGMPKEVKIGDVLPSSVVDEAKREHEARVKFNISDPSAVRPFIDQPMTNMELPSDPTKRAAAISALVHDYRNRNPYVIHAAAVMADPQEAEDEVEFLTRMFYQTQSAFVTMVGQLKENDIVPKSPRFDNIMWENIGFPRLANNLHMLRAIVVYFELDQGALVVHLLFVYQIGEATVFSTRYPL